MNGPLNNLRVIDFGQYIAGPLAAVMLADQGADVIHVDPPGGPRRTGPVDAFFNRGKRRIELDLKLEQDRSTAVRLIETADVVIENFRPGVMERFGLGEADMRAANPRLIYCSLPGFSPDDPRAGLRAWEGVLVAATANCDPRVGEEPANWDWERPSYSALPMASNFAGYLGATGIVAAAIARERTGRGQLVEVPLYDAMFTLIGHSGTYANERGLHSPTGIHQRGAGCFRCADGRYVQFDTSSPRHLTWFARAAGITGQWPLELLDLRENQKPEVNERLHEHLRELFLTRSAREWEELGNEAGSAIGFVRTPAEWIHEDHAQAIRAVAHVDDPELGPMWMAGVPASLSEFVDGMEFAARHLPGADTNAVLDELKTMNGSRPESVSGAEPDLAHPLAGLKVLDIGVALAGPTCGRLLYELGADVIKINAPNGGVGGYLNRGKESLLLDLSSVAGQEVYWKLVDQADVVLENLSPGTSDRLGIGYREVKARRPEVVYTSISSYGRTGPWTEHRGWERQGQAVSGMMERTELPSVLGPYNPVDIGTGVFGTFATTLALYHRLFTGRGQLASASLAQTGTYHQTSYFFDFPGFTPTEPRGYYALGEGPLQRFYRAADRWFFLAATSSDLAHVGDIVGVGMLDAVEPSELEKALEREFATDTAESWVGRLQEVGVAAHVRVPIEELMVDKLAQSRGLSVMEKIDQVGECTMPGNSLHLSDTPARVGKVHRPGSDAQVILERIGMGDRLSALEKSWVVRASDLPDAWR